MQNRIHALARATERRIPDAAVARVKDEPELTWPSISNEHRPVTVCQRGAIRVIVGEDDSIVSVMWVHSRTGGADPSPVKAGHLLREVLA